MRKVKTTTPVPNNAEKKIAAKLETPNILYERAIIQKGSGGLAKSGVPARVTIHKLPDS